ncbi:hypothetical protein [Sinomonas sp. ASV322]|uniref:hypothetical protein n=1 Tax=Sinomonas sp. ASV322 TaxID=3041920 RepID=UPI0027DB6E0D|nr:hypothetical protein [Sinomonas sp. ASV322]MDQ4502649.1 hypothetical protein [Sinomonas sp. ASV322]
MSLDLYDEFGWFPDYNVGTRTSACGAHNWGVMTRPDSYHWTISAINGGSWGNSISIAGISQYY